MRARDRRFGCVCLFLFFGCVSLNGKTHMDPDHAKRTRRQHQQMLFGQGAD
jgi:hypothetical protein